MIALVIVAIVVGAAVLSFQNLTRVELKATAGRLVGLVRSTYSRAALAGRTYRIMFDMDQNTYWVESSKDDVRVGASEEATKEEEEGLKWMDPKEREKKKYLKKPEFRPIEEDEGKKQQMPKGVRIYGVWVEGMKDRVREGAIPLYFFPSGYTQKAQISITDDDEGKHLFVLVTEPLTGEVVVENEEKPIK
jgi:general secretion pathway protein H